MQKSYKTIYYKHRPLFDVLLFITITYSAHIFWWSNIHLFETWDWFNNLRVVLKNMVFQNSYWFVNNFLYDIHSVNTTLFFPGNRYIEINESCTGFKQFYQLAILIVLFPGPWLKKIWFIPLGLFIMHLTNIFRIISLSIILMEVPVFWKFSHDWILRPFFYVIIFGLWWWWNEKIRKSQWLMVNSQ